MDLKGTNKRATEGGSTIRLKASDASVIKDSKDDQKELQLALAEATQTNKKTAGVFLDTLSALAYKTVKIP